MITCSDCLGRGWIVVDARRMALGGRIMFDGLTDIESRKTECDACEGRGRRMESASEFIGRVTDGVPSERLREVLQFVLAFEEFHAGEPLIGLRQQIEGKMK